MQVEVLLNGMRVWVPSGTTLRLCPLEAASTITVRVGDRDTRVEFVCDSAAFFERDNMMACGLNFHAEDEYDIVELPRFEALMIPTVLDYMHRRVTNESAALKVYNMSPECSRKLDALMDLLFPGFEAGIRFPTEGDDVLVVLNGSYGGELEIEESTDARLAELVLAYRATEDEKEQVAINGEIEAYMLERHSREPSIFRKGTCTFYVRRVKRGCLFQIHEYDGKQWISELDLDSFHVV